MVHELNRWKSLNLKLQINSFEKKSRVFQLMRKNSQDNSETNINISLFQGLNTGVVLYRLDKMRENELYNSFLNKQKIDYLVKK